MAVDTDFVALYDELGLDSECTLAEFRKAYRRRVAMLHPDHPGHSSDTSRLQRLNRLYAAATDFHQRHGRLPGSARRAGLDKAAGRSPLLSAMEDRSPEEGLSGPSYKRRYLVVAVLALVALYWLGAYRTASPRLDPHGSADGPADNARAGLRRVDLGMERELVLQILGTPLDERDARWLYGPSWVDFSCGKVVDWYSSPLQPLKVEHRSIDNGRQLPALTFHGC